MKSDYGFKILFILCLLVPQVAAAKYVVQGQINDPERRYRTAIIEYIPSINGLHAAIMKNKVNTGTIGVDGSFYLEGDDLPKTKGLYRFSLLKSRHHYGISTGTAKNYVYLVLDNHSTIEITACDEVQPWLNHCQFQGDEATQMINEFYEHFYEMKYNDLKALSKTDSEQKKMLIYNKEINYLKSYCDSVSSFFPSFVAYMQIEDKRKEMKKDPAFFDRYLAKVNAWAPQSSYAFEINNEISSNRQFLFGKKSNYSTLLNYLFMAIIVGLLAYTHHIRQKLALLEQDQKGNQRKQKLDSLSKKEKEVLQYILEGKSNKEIASALFIEVTTVKSHLGKIYQKLEVKSRKEVQQYYQ